MNEYTNDFTNSIKDAPFTVIDSGTRSVELKTWTVLEDCT